MGKNIFASSESTYNWSSQTSESKTPSGSSARSLEASLLKATRNEIDKYSRLTQSYTSLPTATRALIPTRHTRKLHGRIKEKKKQLFKLIHGAEPLSSCISLGQGGQRKKKKVLAWREGAEAVSATNESTYKTSSEARESKMPDGSSVRLLKLRSLKAARNAIDKYSGLAQSHAPLPATATALTPARHTRKSQGQNKN